MATREQLEAALVNADRAGDIEAAKIIAGELAKIRAQAFQPQPGSFIERAAAGAAEPVVGLAQLASRGLSAVGSGIEAVAGQNQVSQFLQELPARNDAVAREFGAYQNTIAPEGFDAARMTGNLVATLPLALAGGVPATVGQAARAGAVGGGLAGAAQPVVGGDFASQKVQQTATGAAIGGAAGGALQAALKPAVNAARRAYSAVAARVNPSSSVDEIAQDIRITLDQEGIDVAKLGDAYIKQRAAEVAQARSAGGVLDEATLANDAAAKSLGIDLTRGQATQNPSQFGRELFLREAKGGEELATQYVDTLAKLNRNLQDMGKGLPTPTLKVDAGQRTIEALRKIDEPQRQVVNRLYEAAKASAGRETPIDARPLVDKTFAQLEKDLLLSEVPGDISTFLNTISTGKAPLTIGRAEEVVKAINQRLAGLPPRDPQRVALNTIKTNLDDAIESTGIQAGDETAAAFRRARTAAAVRFKRMEKVPLLKQALDETVTPDAFVDKLLYRTTRDEFKATRAYLRANDRAAWDGIRAQALDDLRSAATGGSDDANAFSQSAFNKALGRLKKDGRVGLLFNEAEIRQLNAIGKVGRLVQQGPAGVSRTGLSGAAKASGMLADLLAKFGGRASAIVSATVKKGGNIAEATAAQRPASVTTIPPLRTNINVRPAGAFGSQQE